MALDLVAGGGKHVVRLVEFEDGTRWAARVRIKPSVPVVGTEGVGRGVEEGGGGRVSTDAGMGMDLGRLELEAEVGVMGFIRANSALPVPRVLAYSADEENPVGAAYMLMEVLPGTVAMDALGGHKVYRGVIAREHRPTV